ncbi:MAG: citryl-CoA lyase [Hyphomicrobiaceae bacterium]|nr:citryl-CoA lyase [Hyphomicrobiaceae bacterium]
MSNKTQPSTRLATHTNDELYYRDDPVVAELMGNVSFTEAMFMHVIGRKPTPGEVTILDAVLVTLMEHGLTPSVIAARLTYHSAPEALQAAMAAGLLNVGSQFIGTMENAAKLLVALLDEEDGFEPAARRAVKALRETKQPLPGFGHHLHKPDDPRTPRLFEIALAQEGIEGKYIDAMKRLSAIVDDELGRHLTINATGAVAAVLLEIGVEPDIMRGFAVVSRAGGLLAHIREEHENPTARHIWDVVEETVPYVGDAPIEKG